MNYTELKNLLIKASDAYYKESKPIMSDYDFDMKLKDLEQMEKDQGFADSDSPTQKPGSDLSSNMTDKHDRPMLSLENTYTTDEVASWYNKLVDTYGNLDVIVERKLDGCSFAARFVNGVLVKALSRGDGEVGEDLTQNLRELDDLKNIDSGFTGEVRGEIIMTKETFNDLNKNNEYANPRNLTSGTLKLLDVEKFKSRPLKAYVYYLEENEDKTQEEVLEYLRSVGFTVFDYIKAKNLKDILHAISTIESTKNSEIVELDGAVMKVNNRSLWSKIGGTAKVPHWAKAYKYEPEHATTVVRKIVYQVGRTGKITPVAVLDPVTISGSTVTNATLNNKDFIETMDVRIGDSVEIRKAAEIIPEIFKVHINLRPKDSVKTVFPTTCPDCGSPLVKKKGHLVDLFCPNANCTSKIINKIFYFAHVLEIDGFGKTIINKFYEAGFLKSIPDIYKLKDHRDELVALDRMGETSVDNLLEEIEKSKNQKFYKIVAALGIPNVGEKIAKMITKKYNNLDKLNNVTSIDLAYIDGIGMEIANNIYGYFHNPYSLSVARELERLGVNMADEEVLEENDDLNGMTFCITGALSITRDRYISLIEGCGGKVVSGVTKKTSYLVTNDANSKSKKSVTAKQLNIPIISERQLLKMCSALDLLKELNDDV